MKNRHPNSSSTTHQWLWVLEVSQFRNEDAVCCRSSMSSSTMPFWKHVSAVTPPFPPASCDLFITTWTGWTHRPTPAPLKRSSGWVFYQTNLHVDRKKIYKSANRLRSLVNFCKHFRRKWYFGATKHLLKVWGWLLFPHICAARPSDPNVGEVRALSQGWSRDAVGGPQSAGTISMFVLPFEQDNTDHHGG